MPRLPVRRFTQKQVNYLTKRGWHVLPSKIAATLYAARPEEHPGKTITFRITPEGPLEVSYTVPIRRDSPLHTMSAYCAVVSLAEGAFFPPVLTPEEQAEEAKILAILSQAPPNTTE